jgi:hypothetical protein
MSKIVQLKNNQGLQNTKDEALSTYWFKSSYLWSVSILFPPLFYIFQLHWLENPRSADFNQYSALPASVTLAGVAGSIRVTAEYCLSI